MTGDDDETTGNVSLKVVGRSTEIDSIESP